MDNPYEPPRSDETQQPQAWKTQRFSKVLLFAGVLITLGGAATMFIVGPWNHLPSITFLFGLILMTAAAVLRLNENEADKGGDGRR
jgi:hypothetical protein